MIEYRGLSVDVEDGSNKIAPWGINRNHYYIIASGNGKKERFDYWHVPGEDLVDESDVLEALYIIVSDAVSYHMNFEDFMMEFGYEDYDEAREVYLACKETNHKMNKIYNGSLEELQNELYERVYS